MNSRALIIWLCGVLLVSSNLACGQQVNPNNLPPCPKDQRARYHNCFGTWKSSTGEEYVGDFKDDKFHGYGQGTLVFSGVGKYIGELIDGQPNGRGTSYRNDGNYFGEFKGGFFHGWGTYSYSNGDVFVGKYGKDIRVIGTFTSANGDEYFGEWTYHYSGRHHYNYHGQGIETRADGRRLEGLWENGKFIREEKVDLPNPSDSVADNSDLSALQRVRQPLTVERRSYDEDNRQPEQQRRSQRVNLIVSHTQPASDGRLTISIQTNADTASLLVNGEEQGGRLDGNYLIKRVARVGQDTQFKITAIDIYGNSENKTITVIRQAAPSPAQTAALKPESISRVPSRDAIAIIIGIQDYKRVPKAEFANNDAKEFYEYAVRALGIKQEKIKILLDDEADEVNIVKAFENWLPIQVNRDKTDVYVFYSGHGLPAPDGKSLYFLPHGVDKELLSRTAVGQNEIVAALAAAKPKSVTMFIDACYSGQTRGGDMLVTNAKPVSLKSDTNSYPPNFTVITASANDQISSSSPELKHGIFSFYLMKGMEGEADANKDGKITVGEMQDYLSDKVSRQAMTLNRKQTTQLVGDAGRVLVGR
jgi:hypothetical protein